MHTLLHVVMCSCADAFPWDQFCWLSTFKTTPDFEGSIRFLPVTGNNTSMLVYVASSVHRVFLKKMKTIIAIDPSSYMHTLQL